MVKTPCARDRTSNRIVFAPRAVKKRKHACLECEADVVVHRGPKLVPHFTHLVPRHGGGGCGGGGESAMHRTTKEWIKTKTELVCRRMVTDFPMELASSAENTLKPLRILTRAFRAINSDGIDLWIIVGGGRGTPVQPTVKRVNFPAQLQAFVDAHCFLVAREQNRLVWIGDALGEPVCPLRVPRVVNLNRVAVPFADGEGVQRVNVVGTTNARKDSLARFCAARLKKKRP